MWRDLSPRAHALHEPLDDARNDALDDRPTRTGESPAHGEVPGVRQGSQLVDLVDRQRSVTGQMQVQALLLTFEVDIEPPIGVELG